MGCTCGKLRPSTGAHLRSCPAWYDNPRGRDQPEYDPQLHPLADPLDSLTCEMGSVVDDIRQLYTDFGQRPYRVFSVVYEWSGGIVGRGTPSVLAQMEFLPTPKTTLATIRDDMKSGGIVERGTVNVTEISPRYTEDQVNQMFHCGAPLPEGQEGFIEITMDKRDGYSERRRFRVHDVPERDAWNFMWRVNLFKQELNPNRAGQPRDSATGEAPEGAHVPRWIR